MHWTIRPSVEADFAAIVDIINDQVPEPTTLEDYERQETLRPAETLFIRIVAVNPAGEIGGYALGMHGPDDNPGTFFGRVRVARRFRTQGVAAALFPEIEQWAKANGAKEMNSSVQDDEPNAQAWAERRGFTVKHHLFESVLDLAGWDATPFRRPDPAGIRFTTLAAEGETDANFQRMFELSQRLWRDLPNYDGSPGPSFEDWLKWMKGDPRFDARGVLLAVDGDDFIGLCHVALMPSGRYYNGFTGVLRDYRGQGVALALKLRSIDYAVEKDAAQIRTNNHSANAPMLAINRKLGYVSCPGFYEVTKRFSA